MALVEATRYRNAFEAGLAKARLQAEDLPCVLFDSEMNWGGLAEVRLMVDEDDLAQARRILNV
jgi:hypothetical protein